LGSFSWFRTLCQHPGLSLPLPYCISQCFSILSDFWEPIEISLTHVVFCQLSSSLWDHNIPYPAFYWNLREKKINHWAQYTLWKRSRGCSHIPSLFVK
jgi:hypothetical protein